MLWESFRPREAQQEAKRHSMGALLLTALGTSIDAMVVGITLALVGANILVVAGAIGLATFSMMTIGVMLGQFVGGKLGRLAEARCRPHRDRHDNSRRAHLGRLKPAQS
jgi:putative Mn2+ efflux pump MntP